MRHRNRRLRREQQAHRAAGPGDRLANREKCRHLREKRREAEITAGPIKPKGLLAFARRMLFRRKT